MDMQQVSVPIFIAITIATLANLASSVCHSRKYENSTDFEVQCSKTSDFYYVNIICHGNDWTKWTDFDLDLASNTEIKFDNCTFPSTVNVQNILHSMNLPVIGKTQFANLRWMLNRKSLKDLSVGDFLLTDSDFQEMPFDLMYDVTNVRLFLISNTKLIDIPDDFFSYWTKNLTMVYLYHNKLQKIKKNHFSQLVNLTALDLSHNKITEIEPAAFDKLVNLQSIDLSFNRLRTLPIGVFQRTIGLKSIEISRNLFDELAQDLLANTKRLEKFSMDANNGTLSTLPDMFFGNLIQLQVVSLKYSQLKSVPSNLFTGCSKMTKIYLDNNQLTTLPSGLFDDTRKLQYLRVSCNRLETLPSHIFSKLNRLDRLFLDTNRLTSLMAGVLEGLQSIFEFDASNNNITQIDDRFLHYLKSAHKIILSHNQLTFESHQHYENESSLINATENQYGPFDVEESGLRRSLLLDHNNIREFNAQIFDILKYLRYIDLSNNRISQFNLSGLPIENMLRNNTFDGEVYTKQIEINLQRNPFHCDCNIKDFIGHLNGRKGTKPMTNLIYGLEYECASPPEMEGQPLQTIRLEKLNCMVNTSDPMDACTDTCVCRNYPGKQVLSVDCSYRNLTSTPLTFGKDFDNWSIELNMTGNNLQNAPSLGDPPLANVISLDLSNNNISQVNIDLFSPKLQQLRLHGNSIPRLDPAVLEYLASNNSLHSISLHDNKWICDCDARPLLSFVQTKFTSYGFDKITCHGTTQKLHEMSSSELCADLIFIIVSVSLLVAFLAIVVASSLTLYYKYQREIKVWLYSKQWCLWFVTEDELDKDKQYDAFISFSHKDEDFVEKEIVAKLESGPRPYKLCLHYRDWLAGEWIPVQVSRSVAESRRTIVVLTPNFLESVWGLLEFRAAHTQALQEGRNRVIVIIYGDIGNIDELDQEMRDYLRLNTYIKWGDPWFWDKLRYALPHGMESVKYKSRKIDGQCPSVQLPLTKNGADVAPKNDATSNSTAPTNESIKLLNTNDITNAED